MPGSGSTFTLYLPLDYVGPASRSQRATTPSAQSPPRCQPIVLPAHAAEEIPDDRDDPAAGRCRAADRRGRSALRARAARRSRATTASRALVAMRGADALTLARKYLPTAISLDIFLPDMLGWTVLSPLEAGPRDAPHPGADRHRRGGAPARARARRVRLPQQAAHDRRHRSARSTASSASRSRACAQLLVVEDDAGRAHEHRRADRPRRRRRSPRSAPAPKRCAAMRERALRLRRARPAPARHLRLRAARPKCSRMPTLRDVPIVVFTGRELTADEEAQLRKMAKSIVLKGVQSPERLLDETALFLHRVIADLPPAKQRMLREPARDRRGAGRQEGAGGRRRRAQHLRADAACSSATACRSSSPTTGQEAIDLIEHDARHRRWC